MAIYKKKYTTVNSAVSKLPKPAYIFLITKTYPSSMTLIQTL